MNMPTDEIPLNKVKQGETVVVTELLGGKVFKDKLIGLGILPKTEMQLIKEGQKCPILVGINNTRVMIGCGMAEKILVRKAK